MDDPIQYLYVVVDDTKNTVESAQNRHIDWPDYPPVDISSINWRHPRFSKFTVAVDPGTSLESTLFRLLSSALDNNITFVSSTIQFPPLSSTFELDYTAYPVDILEELFFGHSFYATRFRKNRHFLAIRDADHFPTVVNLLSLPATTFPNVTCVSISHPAALPSPTVLFPTVTSLHLCRHAIPHSRDIVASSASLTSLTLVGMNSSDNTAFYSQSITSLSVGGGQNGSYTHVFPNLLHLFVTLGRNTRQIPLTRYPDLKTVDAIDTRSAPLSVKIGFAASVIEQCPNLIEPPFFALDDPAIRTDGLFRSTVAKYAPRFMRLLENQ